MTISITIQGSAHEVIQELQEFLNTRPSPANLAQPESAPVVPVSAQQSAQDHVNPPPSSKGRRKAPAAGAVLEQTPIEQHIAATADEPMLTLDDARERVRQFHAAGHMDESVKVLEHFKIKKLSDADPGAGGKPSAQYAKVIAYYQSLVDAKKNGEG